MNPVKASYRFALGAAIVVGCATGQTLNDDDSTVDALDGGGSGTTGTGGAAASTSTGGASATTGGASATTGGASATTGGASATTGGSGGSAGAAGSSTSSGDAAAGDSGPVDPVGQPCTDPTKKRCGGVCISPSPNIGCSFDDCTPCPAVTNGTTACQSDSCAITCDPGFDLQGGVCATPPECTDTVQNGDETDVDCGGATCPRCAPDQKCSVDQDCEGDGPCVAGVCVCTPLTCYDIQTCSSTAVDGCPGSAPLDCSGWCSNGDVCVNDSCCTPITACNPGECGLVDNECGGQLDCTTNCAQGEVCNNGSCCTPNACSPGQCGMVSNGCGGQLDCTTNCAQGEVCQNGSCCQPEVACPAGKCGNYPVGCGQAGTVPCATTCVAPNTCGALAANECGCVPKVCGVLDCGIHDNLCGGTVDCGGCNDGLTCSGTACTCVSGNCPSCPLFGSKCCPSATQCGCDPLLGSCN